MKFFILFETVTEVFLFLFGLCILKPNAFMFNLELFELKINTEVEGLSYIPLEVRSNFFILILLLLFFSFLISSVVFVTHSNKSAPVSE